jgi:5,6-dimethylbenzimidazole synthase
MGFFFRGRHLPAEPIFDGAFNERLHELFRWRRDVRRFRREALPQDAIAALIALAGLAPSVGLSEPWRFAVVEDAGRRRALRENFSRANAEALKGYGGDKARLYASLKLEGLDEAPGHLAVFCDMACSQGSGLGRATMPEMLEYSVVAAVQLLWLAARARGIGVGWVSILDPAEAALTLEVPQDWKLVAYLCLGYPADEHDEPELARLGWEQRSRPDGQVLLR